MEVKTIEIRDSATFIPAIAIRLESRSLPELWLLSRAGFGSNPITNYILLIHLEGMRIQYDPYEWQGGSRTMPVAHKWLEENWKDVKSGDVVCVEYILGERSEKKISERIEPFPPM